MRNVRIFFEKTGMAKYISHLDLMRCFSRAIRRAEIDIWYTEGFNPHPFMTFSLPLSLGIESFCETVDIRTNDEMPFDEIKQRLSEAMPSDIKITNVAAPVHKADEICFAEFDIVFSTQNCDKVCECIKTELSASEILVEKKAKQGRKKVLKQVDIKDSIKSSEVTLTDNGVLLNTVLSAGVNGNINPSLLINSVIKDIKNDIQSIDIIKRKTYLSDMTEFT